MFFPFKIYRRNFFLIVSFLLVAFGQPAWSWKVSIIASISGFALFWRVMLDTPQSIHRFFIATGWYISIQLVQLSWMASHPYIYIYGVMFLCAWIMGLQFGLLALLMTPRLFTHFSRLLAVTALWVIMEWSRLFILSGLAFNPVGLALTGTIYSIQFASIGGIYFLSFWVILTNLMVLRAWFSHFRFKYVMSCCIFALIPYIYGYAHFHWHIKAMQTSNPTHPSTISTILVQTAFPVEERMGFMSAEEARQFIMGEWKRVLSLVYKHIHRSIDLIVLPEYVVPYGTFHPIFPLDHTKEVFSDIFGAYYLKVLPHLKEPYAAYIHTDQGPKWLVSNAFFAQALANIFQADVVVGLEDSQWDEQHKRCSYSSAFHFVPQHQQAYRYEKRVLVPMGEYIPFEFCRNLAAQYGIQGSFTAGKTAKVFSGKVVPFSPSICYEEMYGDLIREGRAKGAELFINLTSDAWFPSSKLPQQHFDHARLRTVENGVPLARACNTGVTVGVDSLGQIVKQLGEDSMQSQWAAGALHLDLPIYHYPTIYTQFGDSLILGICLGLILVGIGFAIGRPLLKK